MPEFTVQIIQADGTSETRAFSESKVLIGRGACDIVLTDPHASGTHGEFVLEGGRLSYRDLGSSNGSYTGDGERLTGPVAAAPGTRIRIGKTVVEVRSVGRDIAKTQLLGGTMLAAAGPEAGPGAAGTPGPGAGAKPAPYVDSAPIEVPRWTSQDAAETELKPVAAASAGSGSPAAPGKADRGVSAARKPGPRGAEPGAGAVPAAGPTPDRRPGFLARLFGRRAGGAAPGDGAPAAASPPGAGDAGGGSREAGDVRGSGGQGARGSGASAGVAASEGPAAVAGGSRQPSGTGAGVAGVAGGPSAAAPGGGGPAGASGGGGAGSGGGPGFAGFKAGLDAAFDAATDGTPRMAPLLPAPGPLVLLQAIQEGIAELIGIVGHFQKLEKGWFQGVVDSMKSAVALLKGCWLQAGLVLGVIMVPQAILGWLAAMIPFLGVILLPLYVVFFLAGFLGQAALVLLIARAHLGLRTSAVAAWKAAVPGVVNRWLALFVSMLFAGVASILLIIPGAALGVFAVAACVLEGHGMIAANRRSLALWRAAPIPLLVGAILLGVAIGIVTIPLGIVFGLVPFVGPLIGGILGAVVNALGTALLTAFLVQRYFAHRRAVEGGDPESAVRHVVG